MVLPEQSGGAFYASDDFVMQMGLNGLVECVDRLVEYCPDYEKRVRETYNI